jgi:hypothetical protein
MRLRLLHLIAGANLALSGCDSRSAVPQGGPEPSDSRTKTDQPPPTGDRAFVSLSDKARSDDLNDRLHFCVFENGDDDRIYVGVKYGLWSSGEFDLQLGQRVVFTGHIDYLLYGGTILRMGDAIPGHLDHSRLRITRVTGMLK